MKYFPVYLELRNRNVLIVGYGPETLSKIDQILSTGANVKYISDTIPTSLSDYLKKQHIEFRIKEFQKNDLQGIWLAISSSEDEELNKKVFESAAAKNIFTNVVDVTDLCSFIFPAIITEKDISIAISTSGNSPALAQRIKKEISGIIGEEYGYLAELMGRIRPLILKRISDKQRRIQLFHRLVNSELLDLLRLNKYEEAESSAYKIIFEEFKNI